MAPRPQTQVNSFHPYGRYRFHKALPSLWPVCACELCPQPSATVLSEAAGWDFIQLYVFLSRQSKEWVSQLNS